MLTRDRTYSIKSFNGRPIDTLDEMCPCRTCFIIHQNHNECFTRFSIGCPEYLPEPDHISNKQGLRCIRCGKNYNITKVKLPRGASDYGLSIY